MIYDKTKHYRLPRWFFGIQTDMNIRKWLFRTTEFGSSEPRQTTSVYWLSHSSPHWRNNLWVLANYYIDIDISLGMCYNKANKFWVILTKSIPLQGLHLF